MLCASAASSPPSISAKWTWWDSDEVHRSEVSSLDAFLQLVSDRLGLTHPATLYVYPRGEDNDVREKVLDDQQLKRLVARGYTLYVWERVKGSPARETRDGLPLTVRTRRDTADVARRLSMGPSTGVGPSPAGSPPLSSGSPLLSPTASSPSSPSSANSSTEQSNKAATRYRDDERCVITGQSHQPNTTSGIELHCCHILNYAERARQFKVGFISYMQRQHLEVLQRFGAFIRPLTPEDMRRFKQHRAGSV